MRLWGEGPIRRGGEIPNINLFKIRVRLLTNTHYHLANTHLPVEASTTKTLEVLDSLYHPLSLDIS